MKIYLFSILMMMSFFARGQGFIYDQQSAVEGQSGESSPLISLVQSFTPTLPSVGFIRLQLYEPSNDGSGILYVNLMADSPTGQVLATSESVPLAAGFSGYVNFLFSSPVSITVDTTYYFEPTIQSGYIFSAVENAEYYYAGGSEFVGGFANDKDLWFREGTYAVPEPSSAILALFGSGILIYVRRWK